MKKFLAILILVTLLTALCVVIVPLNCPLEWSKLSLGQDLEAVRLSLGKETAYDAEANIRNWYSDSINGRWMLVLRFDNCGEGKIAYGSYSFHNWFYDSNYNPLPRPYWQDNITTKYIINKSAQQVDSAEASTIAVPPSIPSGSPR